MTTVLFYLVIAAVIGLVVFFVAVLVFGRGEQMAPLDPRTSPAELPDHDIDSEDVRKIRFALALRGYRMSDVDWTLERLGEQISSLRLENARLRDQLSLEGQVLSEDGPRTADDSEPAAPLIRADEQDWVEPQGAAEERERWGASVHPRAVAQQTSVSADSQDRVLGRRAEREAAPAVDR